jgi:hypothetical protein
MSKPPSYHDLHVTAPGITRTSLFDLPFDLQVICTRASGWGLWRIRALESTLLAGEYEGEDKWLVLDVAGHVIVDSRPPPLKPAP